MRRSLSTMCAIATTVVCSLTAADRQEITFADARIFPESVTSTKGRNVVLRQPRSGQRVSCHVVVYEGRGLDSVKGQRIVNGARSVRGRESRDAVGMRICDWRSK